MRQPLRIVLVHGIGGQSQQEDWKLAWQAAIQQQLQTTALFQGATENVPWQADFVSLDSIFAAAPLEPRDWWQGLREYCVSSLQYGLSDWLTSTETGKVTSWERGEFITHLIRQHAGMIVQWAAQPQLRQLLRQTLAETLELADTDLLIGHSLGSLVCYDFLLHEWPSSSASTASAGKKLNFLSIGSQIGHPAVRRLLGGRLVIPDIAHWFHCHNPFDRVLTSRLRLEHERFTQLLTPFESPAQWLSHGAVDYLSHPETQPIWSQLLRSSLPSDSQPLAETASPPAEAILSESVRSQAVSRLLSHSAPARPATQKALLVGINQYQSADISPLSGCINDSYLVSEVLQEVGFASSEIELLSDSRATTAQIKIQLQKLLEGTQPGDIRVFHYSGHGARIVSQGIGEDLDGIDECLVPYDFDYTIEKSIVDDWFQELYSSLPNGVRFLVILDCCHSGGMTRQVGGAIRGLDLPPDLRHRLLCWSTELQTWQLRPLPEILPQFPPETAERYSGPDRHTKLLGRATLLRKMDTQQFQQRTAAHGHSGPFLPLMLQACQENELASECLQGNTVYGAFTYSLVQVLRQHFRSEPLHAAPFQAQPFLTYRDLMTLTTQRLHRSGFRQTPRLEGPQALQDRPLPFPSAKKQSISTPPTNVISTQPTETSIEV